MGATIAAVKMTERGEPCLKANILLPDRPKCGGDQPQWEGSKNCPEVDRGEGNRVK